MLTAYPPCYMKSIGDRMVGSLKHFEANANGQLPSGVYHECKKKAKAPKGPLPISQTRILFNATCWLYWDQVHRNNRALFPVIRDKDGKPVRNQWDQYQVSLRGVTFDQAPLKYLIYLSEQPWLYGSFKARLDRYLAHPTIQKLIDLEFPDPEDDSDQPAFTVQSTYARQCPMPKEEREPGARRRTASWAWGLIADLLVKLESAPQLAGSEVINMDEVREAIKLLPKAVADHLRTTFREYHRQQEKRAEMNLIQLRLAEIANEMWAKKLRTRKATVTRMIRADAKKFVIQKAR